MKNKINSYLLDNEAYHNKSHRNKIELRLFGLQRSGNHAIIGWIAQQFTEPVYFFNNITHFKDPITCWHVGSVHNAYKLPPKGGVELETIRSVKKNILILSYENLSLNKLGNNEIVPNHDQLLGSSCVIKHILLLRDFFNWVSSRLKLFDYRQQFTNDQAERIELLAIQWLAYAREYTGRTNYFGDNYLVRINYPNWASDPVYRALILEHLEIPFFDNTNRYIPNVGGGSSFDGVAYAGNAEGMDINNRSTFFLEDERFQDAPRALKIHRSEIEDLNSEIFGLPWLL
jgi:hypothetical protein